MLTRILQISFTTLAVIGLLLPATGCKRKHGNANNANADTAKKSLVPEGLDVAAYMKLGLDAQKDDRDEEASEAFEHAIKLQPENAEAHLHLGMSYDALVRNEEAKTEYQTAVEQYRKKFSANSNDPTDWFNIGIAFSQLKRHDEAANAFRTATRLKPDYSDAWFELGDSLIKTARYPEAVTSLKKALELDPENYQAQDALEKAQEGMDRINSEVQQQRLAGKNKNANANANGNSNVGGGNSNNKPKPAPSSTPKP